MLHNEQARPITPAGIDGDKAIEEAYGKVIAMLEPDCKKWLVAGGK
jgi:hypothetical protein